jgi:membrane-associated protease RseP (regulator of RpoE activity)
MISVLIFVHEYGHYLVMRRNGIKVPEFTIGFGPTLWQKTMKSGTVFKIKPILIGGYTKPVQSGEGSMQEATAWQQTKVYLAGPAANVLFAILTLTIIYYAGGPMGLKAQDLSAWAPGFLKPLVAAVGVTGYIVLTYPIWLIEALSGSGMSAVMGPVGIANYGGQAAASAPSLAIYLIFLAKQFAEFNCILASFNLIPIPPLDGGGILSAWLTRFGLGKVALGLRYVGTVLLLALFVLAFTGDFKRLLFN